MHNLLQRFKNKKILVIGDLMLDHYIFGDTNRISPEAPVPIVKVSKEKRTAGGAANVAMNLATLGVSTTLLGVTGNDKEGNNLIEILKANNVNTNYIVVRSGTDTIVKTRILSRNQQLARIDYENEKSNYEIDFSTLDKTLFNVDAVIISDYNKGCITQNFFEQLKTYCKSNNIFIASDHKPSSNLNITDVDIITPNKMEGIEFAYGIFPPTNFDIQDVCKKINDKLKPKFLLLTLGQDGMVVSTQGNIIKAIPTVAKDVYDVSGAGDTVISVIVSCLISGLNFEDSAHIANMAAGIVVGKLGTSLVYPEELIKKYNESYHRYSI